MKVLNIYLFILIIPFLFFSCEGNLDQHVRTTYNAHEIAISYVRTKGHSHAAYAAIPAGFLTVSSAMLASASDEAEHTIETSGVHKFNVGSWNAVDNPDNKWNVYYLGIRRVNQYLVLADSIDWSNLTDHPTPENLQLYESRSSEIRRTKYENRFLRAYFHFELMKRFGGIPIMTEALPIGTDLSLIKRNTLSECIQFIVDECDSTANELPLNYPNEDLGRVTKGAALALKSRVLLYAASDLYNDPSWAGAYSNPELISISGDRSAKWEQAANAAKAVIELGEYSLGNDYSAVFKTFNSPEIIFTRREGASNSFERANYPIGYDFGRSGTTPTQNLVDAYEMKNGKAITDPESGYNPQDPYTDRDPRLKMSIITNNSMFKGRAVECWKGGRDGEGIPLATRTGYYLKKYVDEGLDLLTNKTSIHSWHIFRLAEIYLNYAEALNEYDPGNADIATYVNRVRRRANMPDLPGGLNQAEMRERIRNERRVELAFEDHRFWDVRRWMIAPETLNVPIRGMDITKNNGNDFVYQVKTVENRVFHPKMYFYPIPQSELNIAVGWKQNPLW